MGKKVSTSGWEMWIPFRKNRGNVEKNVLGNFLKIGLVSIDVPFKTVYTTRIMTTKELCDKVRYRK